MTPDNVSQERHPRKVALSSREFYAATERGITERLQRKARVDRAVAEASEQGQREYDRVVDAARWRSTADLGPVADALGYSGLAAWFSRGAPGGDYPAWCADKCRAAYADRIDPVDLSTRCTDIEIEQGRLDPSVRQTAIEYSALCMAGRHVKAAVYLKQLRQRRQPGPVRVCRSHTRHLHHARRSTHRTVRSRRASTTARSTGDPGDGEPPEPPLARARGPPRAWRCCAQTPGSPESHLRGPSGGRGPHSCLAEPGRGRCDVRS